MIPSFVCAGTFKAGTTTLHDMLVQHQQICLPLPKETYFFGSKNLYEKGLDYYLTTFFPIGTMARFWEKSVHSIYCLTNAGNA